MSEKTLALARMLEGVNDVFLARNLRLIEGLASRSFTRVSDLIRREKGVEA